MKADRDIEKTYALPEFIAELRRLADALESGESFTLDIEGEEISIPVDAVVSIEHEREDGREELEFQLSWDVEDGELEDDDDEEAEDAEAEESESAA